MGFGGLSIMGSEGKAAYDDFYEQVRQATPPENLFRYVPNKHTYEDICDFVGISPCPKSGKVKLANNMYNWDTLYPWAAEEPLWLLPIYLFFHWVNWKVYK